MPHTTQDPFLPTWESLQTHTTPDWYLDGKFGIFIHWGVYSVPAFGSEWYPRNMYIQGTPEYKHHRQTYGPQAEFGYKEFIPQFKAEGYNPAAWAALFKEAGARFVVPVAEHHDGFPLYASQLTRWNAAKMGPCRDLIGDLAEAVREEGLVFGVSSHRAENWFFMNGGRAFDSDVNDPANAGLYGPACPYPFSHGNPEWRSLDWVPRPHAHFLEDWLARCEELVDLYQPQLFWFDWWIEQTVFQPYIQRFAAYYYNQAAQWGRGAAINYKNKSFAPGSAVLDLERGQLDRINPGFWQNDTSISKNSWGYVHEQDYKTAKDIIGDLVDVVSKNGALLLNVGPRPDGTIPEPEKAVLREIGAWLAVNGEAIYGTRPWITHGEGPTLVPTGSFTDTHRTPFTNQDMRFTQTPEAVYAIMLGQPEDRLKIASLGADSSLPASAIDKVSLLGTSGEVVWQQAADGLHLTLPSVQPGAPAYTVKVHRRQ